jgi:hypothetical protein
VFTNAAVFIGAGNANGNDNIVITGNTIHDTINGVPTLLLSAADPLFSAGLNDSIIITNNIFYNTNPVALTSYSIHMYTKGNGIDWKVNNNKIYSIGTKGNLYYAIALMGANKGGGHQILNNSIGGADASRAGVALTNTAGVTMIGIRIDSDSNLVNEIAFNKMSNFSSTTGAVWGISVEGFAKAAVHHNIIGGNMPYDTINFGSNSIGINLTGTSTADIYENDISNYHFYRGSGVSLAGILTQTVKPNANIYNNTIHDIFTNTTATSTSAALTGIRISTQIVTGIQISGNTIYNLRNTNTGTAAYLVTGISVGAGSSPLLTPHVVKNNKIFNLSVAGTGTSTPPVVVGMGYENTGGNATFVNNMISLGNQSNSNASIRGISEFSSNAGAIHEYYNNTIFINGESSSLVNDSAHSYGFYRGIGTANTLKVYNNVFYMKRNTGGLLSNNYAIGLNGMTGFTLDKFKYNTCILDDTSKFMQPLVGGNYGWAEFDNLSRTDNVPNTNWTSTTAEVPADSLFIDTLVCNLAINFNQTQAWLVNGKGIALNNLSTDFFGNSRSVSVSAGTTDIGAHEFNALVDPPNATPVGNYFNGESVSYVYAGREVAKIDWNNGSLPVAVDVAFYSGMQAPNLLSGKTQMNSYVKAIPNGGAGYTFKMSILYDTAYSGNISNNSSARLAGYNNNIWTPVSASAVNTLNGNLVSTNNTLTALGIFTGTDASNPLPVKWLNFTAKAYKSDVF